jgi:predicted transcriptional regulator YheO
MDLNKAIQVLSDHNKWRRGDDSITQAKPKVVGESIEVILDYVRQSDQSESYIVNSNYGNRVTAVDTKDVTNADEWLVLR